MPWFSRQKPVPSPHPQCWKAMETLLKPRAMCQVFVQLLAFSTVTLCFFLNLLLCFIEIVYKGLCSHQNPHPHPSTAFWRAFISKLSPLSLSHPLVLSSSSLLLCISPSMSYVILLLFLTLEVLFQSYLQFQKNYKSTSRIIYFCGNSLCERFHNATEFNKILASYLIFCLYGKLLFLSFHEIHHCCLFASLCKILTSVFQSNSSLLNRISLINSSCGIRSDSSLI